MKSIQLISAIILCICSIPSSSAKEQSTRGIPDSLFGVKLGGIYKSTKETDSIGKGTYPVQKIVGAIGESVGWYLAFKPLREYSSFPYIERKRNPDDKYFGSSFTLYVHPIIPKSVSTFTEFQNSQLDAKVVEIEWREINDETREDSYFWVKEQCKDISVDLGIRAKVVDSIQDHYYSCTYSDGKLKLEVSNIGSKAYRLGYAHDIQEGMNKVLDAKIRKLRMKEEKPY